MKTSKFKNTGFLYEILVRQITNDVINENRDDSYKIVKSYFGNTNNVLIDELNLYKMLIEEKFDSENRALDFLNSVIKSRKKLNSEDLKQKKYNLVKEIKNKYDLDKLVKTRVPDYKLYSSIYKLFEYDEADDPLDINRAKNYVVNHLLRKNKENQQNDENSKITEYFRKMDSETAQMVYEIMVDKFNEKYKDLLSEQKEILQEYIINSANSENYISYFRNKADDFYNRLKNVDIKDKSLQIKMKETNKLLSENFEGLNFVKDRHLMLLMKSAELLNELNKLE